METMPLSRSPRIPVHTNAVERVVERSGAHLMLPQREAYVYCSFYQKPKLVALEAVTA
jgi:hypothetical protein